MLATLQAGQRYLSIFPLQKKLNLFMPDYRIIRLVKFSGRAMPAFACFVVLWQFFLLRQSDPNVLANVVLTSLFALSIPYQGLWWLGRRAKSPLALNLIDWYRSLYQKLLEEHKLDNPAMPTYQDFATLLQLAEKSWGQKYFDEL